MYRLDLLLEVEVDLRSVRINGGSILISRTVLNLVKLLDPLSATSALKVAQ
jgi:hypothetical protein